MMQRSMKVAVAVLAVVTMTGCSMIFVRPPPPQHLWGRIGWARCTRSKVWPIFDTVFAVGSAFSTMAPFLFNDTPDPVDELPNGSGSGRWNVTAGLLQIAGWGFSAAYGFETSGNCTEFWRDQARRQSLRRVVAPIRSPRAVPLPPTDPAPITRPAQPGPAQPSSRPQPEKAPDPGLGER